MSGPKRNPDKLNTIGVVVVGICGAVLVYVTITALQAFYMNDTSEIQHMADYGGQDQTARGKKADELRNISEVASNGASGTYRMKIDDAMKLVVEDAKKDPSHLTGSKLPPSTKESIPPKFGRPTMGAPAAAPADGAGSGAATPAPATPAGNAGAAGSAAPQTPTGSGPGGAASAPGVENAPAGSGAPTR